MSNYKTCLENLSSAQLCMEASTLLQQGDIQVSSLLLKALGNQLQKQDDEKAMEAMIDLNAATFSRRVELMLQMLGQVAAFL